ncbi:MAG: DUF2975 domain-containing protein [Clostridia bacterium]|nr:DUF2975 domain-containing protein [Clostridia bacterium]
MSNIKLEKEEQKKLKTVSKAIYILAKIGKVFAIIGAVFLVIGMVIAIIATTFVTAKNSNEIEVKVGDRAILYRDVDDQISIVANGEETKIEDAESKAELRTMTKIFFENSKESLIISLIMTLVFSLAGIIVAIMILKYLEKLFKNIANDETPFTLENVECLKKMGYYMLASLIISILGNSIISSIVGKDLGMNLGINVIYILVVYAFRFVFEYGYNIQQESDSTIYGE